MKLYSKMEDSGERVLVRIECDFNLCNESIQPHQDIASSGWRKKGVTTESGDWLIWEYCPTHYYMARP